MGRSDSVTTANELLSVKEANKFELAHFSGSCYGQMMFLYRSAKPRIVRSSTVYSATAHPTGSASLHIPALSANLCGVTQI
jgi:hypothetical protein